MSSSYALVALIVIIALIFDYTNGFHDAANSIATVVSTRVLSPGRAVMMAAFFNFVAFFVGTHAVAKTIYGGLVDPQQVNEWVVLAGLVGAVAWNLITWYLGLPTSSSHALIGGYAGAAIARAGNMGVLIFDAEWPKGWWGTLSFIIISPTVGLLAGLTLMTAVFWIFRHTAPTRVDKFFRFMQLVSASLFSLSHGNNDAQKTMGIIMAALVTGGIAKPGDDIPTWVGLAAFVAIGLGTLSGGWRIVKTMGTKITRLKPVGGFCAETGGAAAIFLASWFGIPVSTTHTITGAIVGVGATQRLSAVRWGVAGRIIWAWVITIPAAAGISALTYFILAAFQ
ncbi:MAG: anion permease [Blastocatellia bacterium]